jgi:hypothetical protein
MSQKEDDIVERLLKANRLTARLVADAVQAITTLRRDIAELEKLVFTPDTKNPEPPPRKRRRGLKFPRGTPLKERMLAQIEIDQATGCWNWLGCGSRFYGSIVNDNGKRVYPHKAMYEIDRGYTFKRGEQGLHTCDNTWCINPDHIRPGTQKQNMEDKSRKNRHGSAIVSRELAMVIRRRYHEGETAVALGIEYGITEQTAWKIACTRQLISEDGSEEVPIPQKKTQSERQSTLTIEDVRDIRRRIGCGERNADIAALYNIRPDTVSQIRHGKRWGGIK